MKRLETEINRIVKLPEVQQGMNSVLVEATGSTSEELARAITTDILRWESVRMAGNIKLQDQ